jgi:glycosyltransferase involved in cell wall biosynthesis
LFLSILVQVVPNVLALDDKDPRVLILRIKKRGTIGWGGVSTHTLSLYKSLLEAGVKTYILVPYNSIPEQHLKDENLSYFTFKDGSSWNDKLLDGDPESIYQVALELCKKYKINIIHVNFDKEVKVAKKICSALGSAQKIDIVYQKHASPNLSLPIKNGSFGGVSAVISTTKLYIDKLEKAKKLGKINVKCVKCLPPMTQLNRINIFDEGLSKGEFFRKKFDIEINSENIVLCCVAHLFQCKNHENLFIAVHKLIYECHIPVKLLLAGDGTPEMRNYLEKKVVELQLQDDVIFWGFVNNIPELLFYSDIKVLVSKRDSFGLAVIEAALMKKPMVISSKTGIANSFIFHNKTGLLCDPNSIDDIASQIKYLIKHPNEAKVLGDAAYDMVKEYYLSNCLTMEYIKFYKEILS